MNIVNQNTGLQFQLVKDEFQQHVQRSARRYNSYSEIAGVVAGVISAITILFTGVYVLRNKVVWITNDLGRRVIAPGQTKFELFGVLSISVGWYTIGPLIGGAVYGLGCLWSAYKVFQLKHFMIDLEKNYNNHALLTGQDIEHVLNKTDKIAQKNLIDHMNFEQLGVAFRTLGETQFKDFIELTPSEAHQQWRGILSLSTDQKEELLVKKLKSRDFKKIARQNPLFVGQLQERLKQVKNEEVQETLQNYWTLLLDEAPQANDTVLTIQFKGESVEVNTHLMQSYSQHLADLLKNRPQDEAEDPLEITDIENPETFKLALQLLNHQKPNVQLNKELVIDLLQIADFLVAPKLVQALEWHIIDQYKQFKEKEIEDIVNKCPALQKVKTLIENQFLSQKMNRTTWETCWQKAQAIHSDALEKHCCQHAKAQVIGLLASPAARFEETHFWFKSCQDILGGMNSNDYKDFRLLLVGKLCVQNVRPLYELALQTNDVLLQQRCVHFCRNNAQALKNHAVWQLGETPEEISEVLYA